MLKIRFFNVAEGDSILLEYSGAGAPFRVLVDTGRAELPESPGSLRRTASQHLRRLGIRFIDVLVLTHLHVDHIQDLPEIMKTVRFSRIYSTFFPPDPAYRIPPIPSEFKAVRELVSDLNLFAGCLQTAEKAGTELIPVTEDLLIPMDEAYGSIRLRTPMRNSLEGQNAVYRLLCEGITVPEPLVYRAAKSRNPNSLRLLVTYAGRKIALDGDYYACYAENELQTPCDILKVGHHGDAKSMTEKLASALRPRYAVISCMREYVEKKDRPSKSAAEWLRKYGAEVLYTDCFAEEGYPVRYQEELLFTITGGSKSKGTVLFDSLYEEK